MSHKATLPCGCGGDVGVSVGHVQGGATEGHTGQVQTGQAERKKRIELRCQSNLQSEA